MFHVVMLSFIAVCAIGAMNAGYGPAVVLLLVAAMGAIATGQ
jgi:hypothetical protein